MIIAIWIVTVVLLGLWTLAAWGLASLVGVAGVSLDGLGPLLAKAPFAGTLEAWWPSWQEWVLRALDWLQAVLQWLGAAAPVLVWATWFFGALALLLLAGALSLLVALLRRALPQTPPVPPAPPQGQAQA